MKGYYVPSLIMMGRNWLWFQHSFCFDFVGAVATYVAHHSPQLLNKSPMSHGFSVAIVKNKSTNNSCCTDESNVVEENILAGNEPPIKISFLTTDNSCCRSGFLHWRQFIFAHDEITVLQLCISSSMTDGFYWCESQIWISFSLTILATGGELLFWISSSTTEHSWYCWIT